MKKECLDVSLVRRLLAYTPATGVFVWRERTGQRSVIGSRAGCLNGKGYLQIRINGKPYLGHRLAYLYMTGCWPSDRLDHKNRIRSDNSWENIRDSTALENRLNSSISSKNTSGFIGVTWRIRAQKWQAVAQFNGRRYWLGQFDLIEDAAMAYRKFAIERHGNFYADAAPKLLAAERIDNELAEIS